MIYLDPQALPAPRKPGIVHNGVFLKSELITVCGTARAGAGRVLSRPLGDLTSPCASGIFGVTRGQSPHLSLGWGVLERQGILSPQDTSGPWGQCTLHSYLPPKERNAFLQGNRPCSHIPPPTTKSQLSIIMHCPSLRFLLPHYAQWPKDASEMDSVLDLSTLWGHMALITPTNWLRSAGLNFPGIQSLWRLVGP